MIIDCDTHCMLPDAFDYLPPKLARLAPRIQVHEQDGSYDVVDFPGRWAPVPGATPKDRTGNKLRGAAFIEDRVEDMERQKVDKHMLMCNFTGFWSYLLDPELGAAIAHSHNVSMLKAMQRYPDKFLGIALLALQNVAASIQELQWAKDNGFSAVVVDHAYPVREHPFGTSLGEHHELWPFFEEAEELELAIFIHNVLHGHTVRNFPRLSFHGLGALLPSDGQVNMVSIIHSGLLDDFPGLRFIIAEQGTGWIRPLAERLDAEFERPRRNFAEDPGANPTSLSSQRASAVPPELRDRRNAERPSFYLRNNFYWTIETEEPELVDAIEYLGADRFLFATDYPHDDPGGLMKWKDVDLLATNERIGEADKEVIRCGAAEALFKLP